MPAHLEILLSVDTRHGYEHDVRFAQAEPLPYGQVYSTYGRLVRGGLMEEGERESGTGPDRRVYGFAVHRRSAATAWPPGEPTGAHLPQLDTAISR